jgi:hypothetical protein
MYPRYLAAAAILLASACSAPTPATSTPATLNPMAFNSGALNSGALSPAGVALRAAAPAAGAVAQPNESMSLHPLSLHFSSGNSKAKDEYVSHYGYSGTFDEDCFSKGIAEFDGDGLKGKTGVFVAIPMADGTCQATFHKGAQTLTLQITIGRRKG